MSYYPESANNNLLKAIVSVHVAYDSVKAQIQQFQNLAYLEPGIVDVLIDTVPYPAAEMVRLSVALCIIIFYLNEI